MHLHSVFGILNILLEGVVCVGKPACQINTMAVCRLVWLNEQDSSIGFNELMPNGIKLGLKQALEMHKLKVVQECEW